MKRLHDIENKNYFLTFRGTTALYLILMWIKENKGVGEIIVPSTVCPSVPLAVRYSGHTLRFCDVSLETYCAHAENFEPLINDQTKAILSVQLFGKIPPMGALRQLCDSKNILLIEDMAQSIGGSQEGLDTGSWGDFSFSSFDSTKILEGQGGILFSKDISYLKEIEKIFEAIPEAINEIDYFFLNQTFRDITMGLGGLIRKGKPVSFADHESEFEKIFVNKNKTDLTHDKILKQFKRLPKLLQKKQALYQELVSQYRLPFFHFTTDEMIWRVPVLLSSAEHQKRILQRFAEARSPISNHYFPTHKLFSNDTLPNAEIIGQRVVNLFLDLKVKGDLFT